MNEQYEEVDGFPDYVVGESGIIVNIKRGGQELRASRNQQGLAKVTMVRNGRPLTRSAAVVVAKAFVHQPREMFDTVINLNNDRMDCRACNLAWRPRWFAIAYHKQFYRESVRTDYTRIEDVDTGEQFDRPIDAAMKYGILYNDIVLSFTNESRTFPTGQRWRPVA